MHNENGILRGTRNTRGNLKAKKRITRTQRRKDRRFLGRRSRLRHQIHLARFDRGVLCRELSAPLTPLVGSEEWPVPEEEMSPRNRRAPSSPPTRRWLRRVTGKHRPAFWFFFFNSDHDDAVGALSLLQRETIEREREKVRNLVSFLSLLKSLSQILHV